MHSMIKFDYVTLMQYFEYSSSNKNSNKKLIRGTVPSRDRKKRFFLICFLTERNIGSIRTLGYVLVIF